MVAISAVGLAVFWTLHAQNERAEQTQTASAFEPCINRKQDPNLIINICSSMIAEGVKSSDLLATLHVRRGYALYRLDKSEEALIDFDRAIELNPKDFEAWQGKSFALDGLDEDLAALEAVEQSLALAPTKRYSVNRKFRLLAKLKRFEEADEYYSQLMVQYPALNDSRLYWMPQELGRMRLALGQAEAAAEVLRIAVLSKPSDQKSRELFFRACIELGSDCPRLLPNTDTVDLERDCDATANQLEARFPEFWETVRSDPPKGDAAIEKRTDKARMTLITTAYITYAVGLQMGKEGETPEDNFLLFEEVLSCVETGNLFSLTENDGLYQETDAYFGGIIRKNMIDLANHMQTKAE